MNPTFRSAELDDVAAVLELWRAADAEPTHTDDTASLRRLIAHQPGALIVAEAGPRIVGTVIAGWDGWRGSVYRLVVTPATVATGSAAGCSPKRSVSCRPWGRCGCRPSWWRPTPGPPASG